MTGIRADRMLVLRGLFDSRASARAAIEAGGVVADGKAVSKPSQMLGESAVIEAVPAHPYVSRGGLKLVHGLDTFGIDPAGRVCLDIGASTGGFTQVLLERGARHVTAVDVGRGQLHALISGDPRVSSLEATDARGLTAADLPEPPDLIVCDASFIALEKLLGVPLSLAAGAADLIGLFKPQFQVGRARVSRGGIVRDEAAVAHSAQALETWLSAQGWPVRAWVDSPILGGGGNAERLFHASRDGPASIDQSSRPQSP